MEENVKNFDAYVSTDELCDELSIDSIDELLSNGLIKLSFDDNVKYVHHVNDRTIVKLRSYIKQNNFDRFLARFGFRTMPSNVLDILNKFGYKMDYSLGGYVTTTTSVIIRKPEDEYDEVKSTNIAMTKAKKKAYNNAINCLCTIAKSFQDVFCLLCDSIYELGIIYKLECDAHENCIETGYCDPNYNK